MNHNFLKNPIFSHLEQNAMTAEQGRRFAMAYYPHIQRTRLYQANALGIAEDEQVQFVLAMILYDEYGNGNPKLSHPEVYRRFMRATGIPDAEMDNPVIIPELEVYISHMMRLSQGGHWLEATAAVGIASEWPIPPMYRALLKGLRTIPGISEDDLELFTSHIVMDEEHSQMMHDALLPHAETDAGQARIMEGVRSNLDARNVFLTGLDRYVYAEQGERQVA